MPLYYHPDIPPNGLFSLDPLESKHILKVMRKKTGDALQFTNGKGYVFDCSLANEVVGGCTVQVNQYSKGADVKSFSLHLGISPIKNPSRFEWFLEKATEAGIGEITPVICHRTEKEHFKPERIRNLLISAMKQSGRTLLPTVNLPVPFSKIVRQKRDNPGFIAWCGDMELPHLIRVLPKSTDTLILIGPEGDFTPEELALAVSHQFQPVNLGHTILRTETAGLAACFAFNLTNV
jgi:16S rRNA (uracil1498-N3)-methyltransferase